MSDELEELRKQKLAAFQEQAQIQQQIQQLENLVKPRMTKPALERFGNIRAAHPDKAVQSLVVLAQLIQSNKLTIIDDTTLKEILLKLTQEKKEFKLTKR